MNIVIFLCMSLLIIFLTGILGVAIWNCTGQTRIGTAILYIYLIICVAVIIFSIGVMTSLDKPEKYKITETYNLVEYNDKTYYIKDNQLKEITISEPIYIENESSYVAFKKSSWWIFYMEDRDFYIKADNLKEI